LRAALVQLEEAELLFRSGAPPDARYTFNHALVQDTRPTKPCSGAGGRSCIGRSPTRCAASSRRSPRPSRNSSPII
jgi:hypothetical protein